MNYFEMIPIELLDIIISSLYYNDFLSFMLLFDRNIIGLINWNNIFGYHFERYKIIITYKEYRTALFFEKLIHS